MIRLFSAIFKWILRFLMTIVQKRLDICVVVNAALLYLLYKLLSKYKDLILRLSRNARG